MLAGSCHLALPASRDLGNCWPCFFPNGGALLHEGGLRKNSSRSLPPIFYLNCFLICIAAIAKAIARIIPPAMFLMRVTFTEN